MKNRGFVVLPLIAIILFPLDAHAYLDPGTGSALLSAIIGAFVAAGIAVKTYWYKIKSIFTKKTPVDDSQRDKKI